MYSVRVRSTEQARARARAALGSIPAMVTPRCSRMGNDGRGTGAEPETSSSRLGASTLPPRGTLMNSQFSTPFVPAELAGDHQLTLSRHFVRATGDRS